MLYTLVAVSQTQQESQKTDNDDESCRLSRGAAWWLDYRGERISEKAIERDRKR